MLSCECTRSDKKEKIHSLYFTKCIVPPTFIFVNTLCSMPETLHKQSKSVHPEGSDATDVSLDNLLRPSALYDYVGQETIKNNLAIFLQAAQKRKEPL